MKLLFLILFQSLFLNTFCQRTDDKRLIDSCKVEITNFFISKGVLDSGLSNTGNCVFAVELNQRNVIGYNEIGIFQIGTFQSHMENHIMIKEKEKIKIFDINNFDSIVSAIVIFCNKYSLGTESLINYLNGSIVLYNYSKTFLKKSKRILQQN